MTPGPHQSDTTSLLVAAYIARLHADRINSAAHDNAVLQGLLAQGWSYSSATGYVHGLRRQAAAAGQARRRQAVTRRYPLRIALSLAWACAICLSVWQEASRHPDDATAGDQSLSLVTIAALVVLTVLPLVLTVVAQRVRLGRERRSQNRETTQQRMERRREALRRTGSARLPEDPP